MPCKNINTSTILIDSPLPPQFPLICTEFVLGIGTRIRANEYFQCEDCFTESQQVYCLGVFFNVSIMVFIFEYLRIEIFAGFHIVVWMENW